jgi:hypothetical protein
MMTTTETAALGERIKGVKIALEFRVGGLTPVGNVLSALAAMGAKPMDANDIAKINEEKSSDFPN